MTPFGFQLGEAIDRQDGVHVFEEVAVVDVQVGPADLVLTHVARDRAIRWVAPHRLSLLALRVEGRLGVLHVDARSRDEREAGFAQGLRERRPGDRVRLLHYQRLIVGGDRARQKLEAVNRHVFSPGGFYQLHRAWRASNRAWSRAITSVLYAPTPW